MATHIGVLPTDVLEALTRRLNQDTDVSSSGVRTPNPVFLRLPHPRTGIPSLFLLSKNAGLETILEIQAVAPPNRRSWFIGHEEIVADGKLLLMTPIDPAFLLIPILQASVLGDGTFGPFRPADDIFEDAAAKLAQAPPTTPPDHSTLVCQEDIIHLASLSCIQKALNNVCEAKDITPDLMVYRFSQEKLLAYLRDKVARVMRPNIFDRSRTLVRCLAKDGLMEDGKEELLETGRIRAACDLVGHYLPRTMHADLLASYDFTKLEEYLKALHDEADAALAAANLNTRRKKGTAQGDATKNSADEKKRKGVGGRGSQGVEKLKKVDTKNMAKISKFFAKAPAGAAKS